MKEDFHKSIIDNYPIGYVHYKIIYDDFDKVKDYEFVEINNKFQKIIGFEKKNLIGHKVRSLLKGKDSWINFYDNIEINYKDTELDYYFETLDEYHKINIHYPNRDSMIMFFRDITEETKQKENYELFTDNTDIQIWHLQDPFTYGFSNKAHADFLGVEREDVEFKSIYDLYSPEEAALCIEVNKKVFKEKKKTTTKEWIVNSKGEKRLAKVFKNPKFNQRGQVEFISCSAEDITEEYELQEEKKIKENILFTMIDFTEELLTNNDHYKALLRGIEMIGKATQVDRVYYWENHYDEINKEWLTSQKLEWCLDGVDQQIDNPDLQNNSFEEVGDFVGVLSENKTFKTHIKDMEDTFTKEILELQGILSILVLPVFINEIFQGFIGFDSCRFERKWTDVEISLLNSFVLLYEKAMEKSLMREEIKERTEELYESKEYFRTTLLSVGDGIIATDRHGKITFINPAIEEKTGWSNEEVEGKLFEDVFNIICELSEKADDNLVKKVIASGEKMEISGQPILVSKDGKHMAIEYTASPIKNNQGLAIGAVVILRDITEEKKKRNKIKYLSMHDQLTGLYNRWYMEEEIIRLDKDEDLPLTIMAIDVNGLKLVNDAFGHEMGDRLLQVVAKTLDSVVRADDVLGRVGGDEFLILLPKTNENGAKLVRERILKKVSEERLESLIISVAIGYAVKESIEEDIGNTRIYADNQMYKDKLIHGKIMRNKTIETVLRNINFKYDQEQIHTERVSQYCEFIARAMDFSEEEVKEIKTAGLLHDIGKIAVPPEILNKSEKLTDEEFELIKRHPETGYHILRSVDEYTTIAEDVLYHHESWDGRGYPQGLKGEEIPINARIITVADAFEAMTASRPYQKTKTQDQAIAELERCAGIQFDPEIVKIFIKKLRHGDGLH